MDHHQQEQSGEDDKGEADDKSQSQSDNPQSGAFACLPSHRLFSTTASSSSVPQHRLLVAPNQPVNIKGEDQEEEAGDDSSLIEDAADNRREQGIHLSSDQRAHDSSSTQLDPSIDESPSTSRIRGATDEDVAASSDEKEPASNHDRMRMDDDSDDKEAAPAIHFVQPETLVALDERGQFHHREMKVNLFVNGEHFVNDEAVPILGEDGNYFHCYICNGFGDVVCCDACPKVYHQSCIPEKDPSRIALDKDEDPWYCPSCMLVPKNPGERGSRAGKPVFRVDAKTGKVLQEYSSVSEAATATNNHRATVSDVLRGVKTHAKGHYFRYKFSHDKPRSMKVRKERPKPQKPKKRGPAPAPVLRVHPESGDIIQEYPSASEAAAATGVGVSSIRDVLNGSDGGNGVKGYHFQYKSCRPARYPRGKASKPVLRIELETNKILEEYPSLKEAAAAVGAKVSNLCHALRDGRTSVKGHHFRYKFEHHCPPVEEKSLGDDAPRKQRKTVPPVLWVDEVSGDIVEEYPSVSVAAAATGCAESSITTVLHRYYGKASIKGYSFRFKSDLDPPAKHKPILRIDKESGETLQEFASIEEAVVTMGLDYVAVYGALSGKKKDHSDHNFRYKFDHDRPKDPKPTRRPSRPENTAPKKRTKEKSTPSAKAPKRSTNPSFMRHTSLRPIRIADLPDLELGQRCNNPQALSRQAAGVSDMKLKQRRNLKGLLAPLQMGDFLKDFLPTIVFDRPNSGDAVMHRLDEVMVPRRKAIMSGQRKRKLVALTPEDVNFS